MPPHSSFGLDACRAPRAGCLLCPKDSRGQRWPRAPSSSGTWGGVLGGVLSQEGGIKGRLLGWWERQIFCSWGSFGKVRREAARMEMVNRLSGTLLDFLWKSICYIMIKAWRSILYPPKAGTRKPQVLGSNPPTCNKEGDRLITHNNWVLRKSAVLNYALVRAIVQDFHWGDPQGEVPGIHLCPVPVLLVLGEHLPLCVGKHYLCSVLLPVDPVIM